MSNPSTLTDAAPVPDVSRSVLLSEDDGAVRILRLNRPDKRNALDTELTEALHAALQAADTDPSVRAVLLTGEGRGFCAGADLKEFAHLTPADQPAVIRRAKLTADTQALLRHLSKPVVSVVHGAAIGGGAGLALGSDMMVVSHDATLGYPEIKHSIVPALVMTGLQRQIGTKLAFELISTGRILTASELGEIGLANRVVEARDAYAVGLDIAHQWAAQNPMALSAIKELFYRVADLPYDAAMRAGQDVNTIMRGFRQ